MPHTPTSANVAAGDTLRAADHNTLVADVAALAAGYVSGTAWKSASIAVPTGVNDITVPFPSSLAAAPVFIYALVYGVPFVPQDPALLSDYLLALTTADATIRINNQTGSATTVVVHALAIL